MHQSVKVSFVAAMAVTVGLAAVFVLPHLGCRSRDADAISAVLTRVSNVFETIERQNADAAEDSLVLKYAAAVSEIDVTQCPSEFRQAFLRHREAWQIATQVIRKYGSLDKAEKDGTPDEKRLLNGKSEQSIEATWLEVQRIADKYGANGPTRDEDARPPSPEMRAVYDAIKIQSITLKPGRFKPGQTVTVGYRLVNTSPQSLAIPVNTNYNRNFNLIGVYQYWIERLGPDATIAAIPPEIARDGRRYAAGGAIIPTKPILQPGEGLDFGAQLSTEGYPPGTYRYYIEYKQEGVLDAVIQSEHVDFELFGE